MRDSTPRGDCDGGREAPSSRERAESFVLFKPVGTIGSSVLTEDDGSGHRYGIVAVEFYLASSTTALLPPDLDVYHAPVYTLGTGEMHLRLPCIAR